MFFFFVHWSVFSVFLEFFRLAGRLQRPSASLLVHLLRAWCQDDDVICYSSFLWNTLVVTGLSFSSLDSCFSPHGEQNDLKNYNNPKNYLTYFYPCFSLDSLWVRRVLGIVPPAVWEIRAQRSEVRLADEQPPCCCTYWTTEWLHASCCCFLLWMQLL